MSRTMKCLFIGGAAVIAVAVPVFAGITAAVPEPSALLMLGFGIAAVAVFRFYKLRKN